MAEPKAQTLLQKMGFRDGDLSTPLHDEIMLWLDANMEGIIRSFDWLKSWMNPDLAQQNPEFHPGGKTWEVPITVGQNNYVVGFIDLRVETKFVLPGQRETHYGPDLNFEVKTSIPSLGELLRQINTYRAHCTGRQTFIVVAPDDRFAAQLESQRVHFLKYDPR